MPAKRSIKAWPVPVLVINSTIIALSIFLFLETLDYPGMSGLFPRLVLIMIGGVTIADLILDLRNRTSPQTGRRAASANEEEAPTENRWKVILLAISMFTYFAFLRLLGVIAGTFLFIYISGWCLGYRKTVSLLVASGVISVCVYLIFVVIMETFLPTGYFIDLLRR